MVVLKDLGSLGGRRRGCRLLDGLMRWSEMMGCA
jgi:hypothetical protein